VDDSILNQDVRPNDLGRSSVAGEDEGTGSILNELQRLAGRRGDGGLCLR